MDKLTGKAILKYFDNFSSLNEIKSGHTNKSFIFKSAPIKSGSDEKKYIIRQYAKDQKTPRSLQSINFEINLINLFQSYDIPTPYPVKNKSGEFVVQIENYFFSVFEYIDGEKVYGKLKPIHFEQVGQTMAKIHQITREQNLKTDIIWPEGNFWNHVFKIVQINKNLLSQKDFQLAENLKSHIQNLKSLPECLIHGDFHFGNLLFKDDELVGLLDFDHYRMGHFIDDITRSFVAEMAHTGKNDYHLTKEFLISFCQGYYLNRKPEITEFEKIPIYIHLHYLNQLIRLHKEKKEKIKEFKAQVSELLNYWLEVYNVS